MQAATLESAKEGLAQMKTDWGKATAAHDAGNAIAAAEAKSDGEIIAITADRSDSYHDVGLHYAVLVLFMVLAFFAAWPSQLEWWWTRLMGWSAEPTHRELLTLLLGFALLKFLAVLFILASPTGSLVRTPLEHTRALIEARHAGPGSR